MFKFQAVLARTQPLLSRSVEKQGDQSRFKYRKWSIIMQFAVEKVGREIVFFLHVVGDSVSIPCRPHRHCVAACACGRGNPAPPLSFYITRLLLVVPSLSWQHKEHFFDFEKTVSKKRRFLFSAPKRYSSA
jgi:hypothetical protein